MKGKEMAVAKTKKKKYIPYPETLYVKDNGADNMKTIRETTEGMAVNIGLPK
jgi:hypothetical protein